jgi:hypothetical protein
MFKIIFMFLTLSMAFSTMADTMTIKSLKCGANPSHSGYKVTGLYFEKKPQALTVWLQNPFGAQAQESSELLSAELIDENSVAFSLKGHQSGDVYQVFLSENKVSRISYRGYQTRLYCVGEVVIKQARTLSFGHNN